MIFFKLYTYLQNIVLSLAAKKALRFTDYGCFKCCSLTYLLLFTVSMDWQCLVWLFFQIIFSYLWWISSCGNVHVAFFFILGKVSHALEENIELLSWGNFFWLLSAEFISSKSSNSLFWLPLITNLYFTLFWKRVKRFLMDFYCVLN